jgi:outer membrane autotransporter protein
VDQGASFTNLGTVTGGAGGAGGSTTQSNPGGSGLAGSDGAGIRMGSDTHVINNGTIAYGGTGFGAEYADVATGAKKTQIVNAVEIVGNNNIFEIWGKSQITGNVVAQAGTKGNSLVLGGDDAGTIDGAQLGGKAAYAGVTQYQGFASYAKDGSSTWTMTGVVNDSNNWDIKQGTLALSADGSIAKAANVTVDGTLDISGLTAATALNNLTGSGTVALGAKDLTVNDTGAQTFGGGFTGSGALTLASGTLTLNGDSSGFTGNTEVASGVTLALEGKQGGNVIIDANARFQGGGAIGGNLEVTDDGHIISTSGQTMTIGGNLIFNSQSQIDVGLGGAANAALFAVAGDLTTGGSINITDTGGFGGGVYKIITYDGQLAGGGTAFTVTGVGGVDVSQVQITTDNKEVDLINNAAGTVFYWNGSAVGGGSPVGGDGDWDLGSFPSPTNWVDPGNGYAAEAWRANHFAVFKGTGGTVNIVSGVVPATGMQFEVNGYVVTGGVIFLANGGTGPVPIINVGDGTAAGATVSAKIDSTLDGVDGVNKMGLGTLILTGDNTYTGNTTITQGTLQLGDNTTTGSIRGDVNIAKGAIFAIDRSDSTIVDFSGNISGDGSFVKMNTETVRLSGDNDFTGGIEIQAGVLEAGSATAFGTGTLLVDKLATADLNSQDLTISGLFGEGTVALGKKSLTLNGENGKTLSAFSGDVTGGVGSRLNVDSGVEFWMTGAMGAETLEIGADSMFTLGDGTTSGTLTSSKVTDNGTFVINLKDKDTTTVAATLEGNGELVAAGNGSTVKLTADSNNFSGKTTIGSGTTLQLGDGGATGNLASTSGVDNSGTLAFDHQNDVEFSAVIDGGGQVQQLGDGLLTLSGANTFAGGLDIEKGTVKAGIANSAFGSGLLTVAAGARADLDGFNTTVGGLTGNGNVDLSSGAILTLTNGDAFDGVIGGAGGLTLQSGQQTLSGQNNYTGDTRVEGGVLEQGAANAFSTASKYSVMANSGLNLGGFNTTVASLDNNGVVIFGGYGTAGTKLTVAGDYSGQNGLVAMHTALGDDNSTTDKLVVNGDTMGNATLQVLNDGGVGAQTVQGIEVVSVAGQSGATFTLKGDYQTKDGQQAVVGGAYAYTLRQGQGSNARSTDGNWYLTSALTNPVDPVNPVDPNNPDNPVNPVDPNNPDNPDTPVDPSNARYSAGVPVYEGYLATMQSLNKLPTLQERVGERYWTGKNGDGQSNGGIVDGRGIWARIEGAHNRFEPETTTARMKQDVNTVIMQAGVDGQFYESDEGRWIAGITGQYGHGRADVSSFSGDGDIDTNAWSLGATSTWYGKNGFYIDGQAQVTWFDSDLDSWTANTGLASARKATGYAASIEAGQRFAIDQNWSLTPQAQLLWSSIDADAFQDTWKARVSMHDGDSLIGRLGLAVNHDSSWQAIDGTSVNTSIYGIANIYQEFLGGTSVNVAGVNFDTDAEKTWAGIGAGGTYAWANSKYAIYGQGSIDTSLTHFADNYALKGTVGFKMNW